jgi:hypothetical protein
VNDYFIPEAALFFLYSSRSAALTPARSGFVLAVLAAGAASFGFFDLAKAAEVETARIARPTRIFFMLCSLEKEKEKDATAVNHKPRIRVKNAARQA